MNFNAISPDRLDPSLTTEESNLPLHNESFRCGQPFSEQIKVSSSYSHYTRFTVDELQRLRNENEQLKNQMTVTKEELESYKNPGTCSLRSILKYLSSRKHLPAEVSTSESQSEFHLKKKHFRSLSCLQMRKVGKN